jgi:2-polyprenyl-3-methyl-5-hydroxy-6-metoxy-1,4-benzoquinol methylase
MEKLSYAKLKRNELNFQNTRYGKSSLQEEIHKTSIEECECSYLTPIHVGGRNHRGLLYSRAVQELLRHDIQGRRVLDYCCGSGRLAVYLAMKGATVYGFDFSEKAIELAKFKAKVNNVQIAFEVMDAEHLLYPDNYFDFVIGFEALHHVIVHPRVPSELARIVRQGGKVIFAENWGGNNPLFQVWRLYTTLKRNQSADRGEVILHQAMLDKFLGPFKEIHVEPLSIFYMSKKYIRNRSILKAFLHMDHVITGMLPFLKDYCGEAIVKLSR